MLKSGLGEVMTRVPLSHSIQCQAHAACCWMVQGWTASGVSVQGASSHTPGLQCKAVHLAGASMDDRTRNREGHSCSGSQMLTGWHLADG